MPVYSPVSSPDQSRHPEKWDGLFWAHVPCLVGEGLAANRRNLAGEAGIKRGTITRDYSYRDGFHLFRGATTWDRPVYVGPRTPPAQLTILTLGRPYSVKNGFDFTTNMDSYGSLWQSGNGINYNPGQAAGNAHSNWSLGENRYGYKFKLAINKAGGGVEYQNILIDASDLTQFSTTEQPTVCAGIVFDNDQLSVVVKTFGGAIGEKIFTLQAKLADTPKRHTGNVMTPNSWVRDNVTDAATGTTSWSGETNAWQGFTLAYDRAFSFSELYEFVAGTDASLQTLPFAPRVPHWGSVADAVAAAGLLPITQAYMRTRC